MLNRLTSTVSKSLFRVFRSNPTLARKEFEDLPEGFDRDLYWELNPDVKSSGMDPVHHYQHHGRSEGRLFSLPSNCTWDKQGFDPLREVVLVVSHEASRTGAPVLSLNLVQAFVAKYNVLVLLLGGGSLSQAFKMAGASVITVSNLRGHPGLANVIVGQLCKRFVCKFALVNSIESREILPALAQYFVPSISLFHEFSSYTRPRSAFREALFWSGESVFSANVTRECASAEYPDLDQRLAHILPQGRCLLPSGELSEEQRLSESKRIRHQVRPPGFFGDGVVILGAGFVQLRKGVDLFLECASRVVTELGGTHCRFVWIGKGYDPENDLAYSVYMADQIRRAGLEQHVFFIEETTAIETAYEEADLFLLSSRLDPLPNVAIDAMAFGVPVLCFDKTTGIADFLIESGLRKHCVAKYLDTAELSQKILALAASKELREEVSIRCREASTVFFCMKDYVARLEHLAHGVVGRTRQERADTETILESGLFRRDFACAPQQVRLSNEVDVRAYVRAWASGIDRRKPFPGFHPEIYRERHGCVSDGGDPFADYIREGAPEGPWKLPVIVCAGRTPETELPCNERVALHIHAYYPELLPEISARLLLNQVAPDLFVSIASEDAREQVIEQLKGYRGRVVEIRLVPNRGRDIGPFLTAFGETLLANYDFVGHIHTKRSADVKDAAMGAVWYRFLLENLLGGEACGMADTILATMAADESIGMVFPDDPNVLSWGEANLSYATRYAEGVGLEKLPEHFAFPVGTMFWGRASALTSLVALKFGWDDYPDEPLPYDGTLLHAIERLFPLTLPETISKVVLTNVVGVSR